MKTIMARTAVALGLMIPGSAFAQTTADYEYTPQVGVEPPATGDVQLSPPPAPSGIATPAETPLQGQWIYTDAYGWIWVPADATPQLVGAEPYVYLYTPLYGWTWYVSPWGPRPFYLGSWVHHAYHAPHVWLGGRWIAPHLAPRVY